MFRFELDATSNVKDCDTYLPLDLNAATITSEYSVLREAGYLNLVTVKVFPELG
jgi:hypothetical protein